ncbi:hypothetical protein Ancab_000388 [Ancistrocladus abbreviatus]
METINKYAFSGGQDSIENHRKYGANLENPHALWWYLNMFLFGDLTSPSCSNSRSVCLCFSRFLKKRGIPPPSSVDAIMWIYPTEYLGFFLEDDAELEHIRMEYGPGRMLTGEVKKRLIEVLTELVERHRAAVTDEMVDAFMAVRPVPNMFN